MALGPVLMVAEFVKRILPPVLSPGLELKPASRFITQDELAVVLTLDAIVKSPELVMATIEPVAEIPDTAPAVPIVKGPALTNLASLAPVIATVPTALLLAK